MATIFYMERLYFCSVYFVICLKHCMNASYAKYKVLISLHCKGIYVFILFQLMSPRRESDVQIGTVVN